MIIDILTLFPGMFDGVLKESMLKRGQAKGLLRIKVHNLRDWTRDRHRTTDDTPYGGGPGMVMMVEPLYRALKCIAGRAAAKGRKGPLGGHGKKRRVILLTPQGATFNQRLAREFAKAERLVLVCGHYEGVDERIRSFVTDEVSVGDYVLTCGEVPAMVLIDGVSRLIPGVLGDRDSVKAESFEDGLLEYPQYTRPRSFKGMKVPNILFSGDHEALKRWRFQEALKRTKERRPDLLW